MRVMPSMVFCTASVPCLAAVSAFWATADDVTTFADTCWMLAAISSMAAVVPVICPAWFSAPPARWSAEA